MRDAGDIISPWNDDNGNTRFTSTVKGDLGYLVPGFINNLDVNSCGDLLYSVVGYPSTTSDLYHLGLNVPCMTESQRTFNLAVARTADSTGNGSVTSSPAVINLTASDKFSMAALPAGSVVTLTATPDANSAFMGWTGACSGTEPCQVTMDLVKSVNASFQPNNDTGSPTVTITSPVAGATKNSYPQLLYSVSDGNVVTKVDGVIVPMVSGEYFSRFSEGEHVVRVESTDGSGNLGFAEVRFTVDTIAPIINIASPVAGVTNVNRPSLFYGVYGGTTVVVKVDGTIVVKVDGISVGTRAGSSLGALTNGTHTLTVESADAAGNVGVASVTFTVDYTPLLLTPVALAYGVTGTNYSQRLTATGSVQPYVWSVNYGALPPGLSLNSATGEITGVPTAAGVFDFYVKVAADNGTETYSVSESIKILTPVAITAVSLGSGYAGEAYAGSVSATGGAGNYAWSVASGTLPAGLTLNSSTGTISGAPSAAGTFTFTVQATDYHSAATQTMTVVINPARPDLVVTSVYGPTSSGGGKKVTVYARVTNRGAGTAPASTVSIYLSNDSSITSDDLHLAFASVSSLPSGSSQVVAVSTTLPKTLPGGNYYFGAIADEPASMEESNETNNPQVGNMVSVK